MNASPRIGSAGRLVVLALLTASSLHAEPWRWAVESSSDSERVLIRPRREGFHTFEEALSSLNGDQVVTSIGVGPMPEPEWETMQRELFEYFELHFPAELAAASASSGNLHNPALAPLRPGYREALLSTSWVADIGETLERFGYEVVDVGFEKFSMNTRRDPPTFSAASFLVVEKQDPPVPGDR